MAKKAGNGMQLLGILGGIALLMVAWRFPVPFIIAPPTTLLSLISVLLGIIIGPVRAGIITALYVLLLVLDVPQLLWRLPPSGEPFLAVPANGFEVGLVIAALLAGYLTPRGANSSFSRVAIAAIGGHLAYLVAGVAWLARFGTWPQALTAVIAAYGIAALIKSAAAFAIAATAGTYVRR